jgi:mono/diheme cytochrome c family protein
MEREGLVGMINRMVRAAAFGACLAFVYCSANAESADSPEGSPVDQGRYLATAGNCISCHTSEGGESFAGGVAFATPFGTMYSTNITPDPDTGIGRWTLAQFSRALREGVRPDGQHLYPAFPYTSFTRTSDADVAAIFSYLKTLAPVNAPARENELRFPFSQRWLLGMWKMMYFEAGRYQPDKAQSAQWNRGAYLVQGLGHCGACHTPRTFLGAEDSKSALSGGTYKDKIEDKLVDWSASDLTSGPNGLGQWQADDIASYLRLGFNTRAGVFGGMNEVVVNSTSHLSQQDASSIATYLRSLPASAPQNAAKPDDDILQLGSLQYDIHCGTCHLPTGLGSADTGPPLVGSPVTLAADPASLINVTLHGAQRPQTPPSQEWLARKWKIMEPFADKLSDEDAAALLSYIRNAWGNKAGAVTAEQVTRQR